MSTVNGYMQLHAHGQDFVGSVVNNIQPSWIEKKCQIIFVCSLGLFSVCLNQQSLLRLV